MVQKIGREADAEMRVLIVDDNAFMRLRLREILESAGHEVVGEAADGHDAITKYIRLKPNLVTMDLMLPSRDGIMTTKIIRSIDPRAKVLIISAMGQEAMVKEAVRSGACDFIIKPVDENKFLTAVTKVSDNSS